MEKDDQYSMSKEDNELLEDIMDEIDNMALEDDLGTDDDDNEDEAREKERKKGLLGSLIGRSRGKKEEIDFDTLPLSNDTYDDDLDLDDEDEISQEDEEYEGNKDLGKYFTEEDIENLKDDIYTQVKEKVLIEAEDILRNVKSLSGEDKYLKKSIVEKNKIIEGLKRKLENSGRPRFKSSVFQSIDGKVHYEVSIPSMIKKRYISIMNEDQKRAVLGIQAYIDDVLSSGRVVSDGLVFSSIRDHKKDDTLNIEIDVVKFRRLEMFCEARSLDTDTVLLDFVYQTVVKNWHPARKRSKKASISASVPSEIKESFTEACRRNGLPSKNVIQRMMTEYIILSESDKGFCIADFESDDDDFLLK